MQLHRQLIRQRIDAQFQGSAARLADQLRVHRSTVARWLDPACGVFPRTGDAIVALAVALDVDPFVLWEVSVGEFPALSQRTKQLAMCHEWERLLPALTFLEGFVYPRAHWPPGEIAAQFHRPWYTADFWHDPNERCAFYGGWVIAALRGAGPQVWHFASQAIGAPVSATWEPFGFVTRVGGELCLYGCNGVVMRRTSVATRAGELVVRAWFGERQRRFRIASLHPFAATPAPDAFGGDELRFCLVGRTCERQGTGGALCELKRICNAYRPSRS